MKLMDEFIAAVDAGEEEFDPSTATDVNNEPYLKVHTIKNGDAREIAKTLSVMLPPGVVVNEEGQNRRVHIFGNDEMQDEAAKYIGELDTSDSTPVEPAGLRINHRRLM